MLKKIERQKLLLLALAACFIAASYAILRPLKTSVFFQIVGKEYFPLTKFIMLLVAIPLVGLYSKLVDTYRKHHVLYTVFSLYSLFCAIATYFLAHPVYGIANTNASPYRLLGWIFSIIIDFYPTFAIGSLWAFINSVSTDESAKKSYGFIYVFIKIGNLLAVSACFAITQYLPKQNSLLALLIAVAGALTLCATMFINRIVKRIPKTLLTGYQGEVTQTTHTPTKSTFTLFEGCKYIFVKPYVFGIFLLFYFYDVIFTIAEYQAQVKLSTSLSGAVNQFSSFLFLSAGISQLISLGIALFLTSRIMQRVKPRNSLIILPIVTAGLMMLLFLYPTLLSMLAIIALLPAIHYSVNSPVRETLFIPTIKDIQFKSKAWIDSFGRIFSKSSASVVNMLPGALTPAGFSIITICSLGVIGVWGVIAHIMGKSYEKTIENKDIVG